MIMRREGYLLPAVFLGTIAPLTGWPMSPVPEYLELRIDVRESVDRVMDQLQKAGKEAGLQCIRIPSQALGPLTYHRGLHCAPAKSADGRFNGSIGANSIEGTKTVIIWVFSIDGRPYQKELHPSVGHALKTFKLAITADAHVKHFQECVFPETEPCRSPLPD